MIGASGPVGFDSSAASPTARDTATVVTTDSAVSASGASSGSSDAFATAAPVVSPTTIDTNAAQSARTTAPLRSPGLPPTSGRRGSRDHASLPLSPSAIAAGGVATAGFEHRGSRTSSVGSTAAFPLPGQPLQIGFYGVFDGHGGTRASEFVAGRLHTMVAERLAAGHTIR